MKAMIPKRPLKLAPDGIMIVDADGRSVCAQADHDREAANMLIAAYNDSEACDVCGGVVVMESSTTLRCTNCGNAMGFK
jgi:hypothetical protein